MYKYGDRSYRRERVDKPIIMILEERALCLSETTMAWDWLDKPIVTSARQIENERALRPMKTTQFPMAASAPKINGPIGPVRDYKGG